MLASGRPLRIGFICWSLRKFSGLAPTEGLFALRPVVTVSWYSMMRKKAMKHNRSTFHHWKGFKGNFSCAFSILTFRYFHYKGKVKEPLFGLKTRQYSQERSVSREITIKKVKPYRVDLPTTGRSTGNANVFFGRVWQ